MVSRNPPPQSAQDLTEFGPSMTFAGVRSSDCVPTWWIRHYPVCAALARHGILHVNLTTTRDPYQVVRARQTTHFFLAPLSGEGQVNVDGAWRVYRPGLACLLPANVYIAFKASEASNHQFCSVCYAQTPHVRPLVVAGSPVLARFEAAGLRHAIEGLTAECQASPSPARMDHWVDLIHSYVMGFAQPFQGENKLYRLWETVALRLHEPWTVGRLARESGWSPEYFRRLCNRELGRSPIQQLISLRMRRAAELLLTTNLTLEAIADAVHYPNAFVFSNAFKAHIGCRPSEYRKLS